MGGGSVVRAIIRDKNPDLADADAVAEQVGVGAIVFNDLKNARIRDVKFDLAAMTNFDGETGPYVQYTAVRARRILTKLAERGEQLPDFRSELTAEAISRQLADEGLWQLLLNVSKADVAVSNAIVLVSFGDRHRREEGMPADRAAITAAKGRLRPIIMTACALISGMIPMSLGLSRGS